MNSRVFSADKAILGVMAFAFGLFFELHISIWWVSRSTSLGDLALLLGMGAIAASLLSVIGWYVLKFALLLQAGRISLRKGKTESSESMTRTEWWLTAIKWYFALLVSLLVSIAALGLLLVGL